MTTRNRLLGLATLLAVLAAACGSSADQSTEIPPVTATVATTVSSTPPAATEATAPPSTSTASSPTTLAGVTVDLESCDDPGEFAILCEAYDLLTREFVDELDPAALAAGAARGIEEFAGDPTGAKSLDAFTCPLPTDDFAVTCDAAAAAVAADPIRLDSLAEAAVRGMFDYGLDDPNSVYFSPSVVAQLEEERTGTISGIGSLVQTQELVGDSTEQCAIISETCEMRIVGIIEDGPAESAGLRVGDVMRTVDGASIIGWSVEEVVGAVRGPEGTDVVIGVERGGQDLEFLIQRAPIVVPIIDAQLLDGNVGYLQLSQFTSNSPELFRADLEQLLANGAESLVIDFRNNPGGTLQAAVSIASEFLTDGLVLRTEAPTSSRDYEVREGGVATDPGLPVVVLVNGGSASASEVVSGVLQETGRATIIGTVTFGKNTVQQQFGLSNGGAVKVTIARWVTPDGLDFGRGITPDVLVDVPTDGDPDVDYQLEAALQYLAGL